MSYAKIIKHKVKLRRLHIIKLVPLVSLLSLSALTCGQLSFPQESDIVIRDDFGGGKLNLSHWVVTKEGDFAEMLVDIYDVDPAKMGDYRLRLAANTVGTSDDTVKYLGVRSLRKIDLTGGAAISFDLDWNNQLNGSYLTAGIYLSPTATDAHPENQPEWAAFEYVGVPPGENARFQVAGTYNGNPRVLFTEGWPDQNRAGRKIANQHIELVIDSSKLKVKENKKEIFYSEDFNLDFSQAYLYLQMSSHSNYPPRTVYFDNILVKRAVRNN